jgi:hypothetical protein
MRSTGIGTSLLLIASGAILAFAVNYQLTGIDINAIGWILILVGFVALVMSFLVLGSFTGFDDVIQTGHTDHTSTATHSSPQTLPHEHRRVQTTDVVYEGDNGSHVEREHRVTR